MNEIYNDVAELLRWQRDLSGGSTYLENALKEDNELHISSISEMDGSEHVPQKTSKIIHQNSPELDEYYLSIKECNKCTLSITRKNFVFGAGNPKADLMFIGEAPGQDEDMQGVPFVGRAGKLLDKMLLALSLKRDDVFIANVLKCRPPNNRDPLPEEILKCEPYLQNQLELIQPKVLVALGRVAGSVLLREEKSLREFREQDYIYNEIPLIVTYHPAALLRHSQWKRSAWDDFKKVLTILSRGELNA